MKIHSVTPRNPMSVIERFIAVLSTAFLVQLALPEWDTRCPTDHGPNPTSHGPEQGSHAPVSRAMAEPGPASVASLDSLGTNEHQGCRLPSAPSRCVSMALCGATAAPGGAVVAFAVQEEIILDLPEPGVVQSSPAAPPEPPPPRA